MVNRTSQLYRILIMTIVLIVPVNAGVNAPSKAPGKSSPNAGSESGSEPDIDRNAIEAFTEPSADVSLAASEMGLLASVSVKEGDVVRRGQTVAALDDRVLTASLKVAEAARDSVGELNSARATVELRASEVKKLAELRTRNHASPQEYDRAVADLRIAEARLQAAMDENEVRQREYDRIQAQLLQRTIVSSIDGVVVDVLKEPGEFVSPSEPVVARIVRMDPLKITFSVPNSERHTLTSGQDVMLTVGEQTNVRGTVQSISPTGDGGSDSFRVKVELPNPALRFFGGVKAVLHLDDDSMEKALRSDRLAKRTDK